MRHLATTLVLTAMIGMALPATAQTTEQRTRHEAETAVMMTESHMKAAGYDVMMAKQAIQAKDQKMAKHYLNSANAHLRAAENDVQTARGGMPQNMEGDLRRVSTAIGKAEADLGRDMNRAGTEVTRIDNDLRQMIRRHDERREQGRDMRQPEQPQRR